MSTSTTQRPTSRHTALSIVASGLLLLFFITLPLATTWSQCGKPLCSSLELATCYCATWVSVILTIFLGIFYASLTFGRVMPAEACLVLNPVGVITAWLGVGNFDNSPYVMFGFLAITFEILYIRTITLTARDEVRTRLEAILSTLLPEAWHPMMLAILWSESERPQPSEPEDKSNEGNGDGQSESVNKAPTRAISVM